MTLVKWWNTHLVLLFIKRLHFSKHQLFHSQRIQSDCIEVDFGLSHIWNVCLFYVRHNWREALMLCWLKCICVSLAHFWGDGNVCLRVWELINQFFPLNHLLNFVLLVWHENIAPQNIAPLTETFCSHFWSLKAILDYTGKKNIKETLRWTWGPLSEFLSSVVSLLGVFLADGDVLQHILRGAHSHRSSLVDALRLDVQDVLKACGGHAARLLHDEGHGVAFVQQPQLWAKGEVKFYVLMLKSSKLTF